MDYLPIFVDLRGRTVLVVGGGEVASRKVALAREAHATLRVVAPSILPAIRALDGVACIEAQFAPAHLEGASLVIAATSSREVNAAVSAAAQARGLWVNVVDHGASSSFIVPSIVDRSPVIAAVSTGGASPVLARRLRAALEVALPAGLSRLATLARSWRAALAQDVRDPLRRRRFWDWFFDSQAARTVIDDPARSPDLAATLHAWRDSSAAATTGCVYLIGAGPGDPGLLTVRALELLGRADVILYDRLVSPEILSRARRDARRVDVGKQGYGAQVDQATTLRLLIDEARAGHVVVRLKGGDPFVFGRGGEEALELARAGIPVHVVPGITAALGCAASTGIPLTHRGEALGVSFVTARSRTAAVDVAALEPHEQTWVVYMGMRQLAGVVDGFRERGLAADTPAAIIVDGTRATQRTVYATLGTLTAAVAAASLPADAPSLLVVGRAVAVGAELEALRSTAAEFPAAADARAIDRADVRAA